MKLFRGNEGRGTGGDWAQIFLPPDVCFKEGRRAKTRVNRVSSSQLVSLRGSSG